MQGRPLVDPLSSIQEAVRGTETNICTQKRTLRELLPTGPYGAIRSRTKHSTFLHPKSPDRNDGNLPSNESPINEGAGGATGNNNSNAQNGYVNGDGECALTGTGVSTIGLPIAPVKVRARSADPPVLPYAFLDSGSNTTFCSHQLMEMLTVDGEQTTLSLTTLGKQNSVTECRVFKLEVLDLTNKTSSSSRLSSRPRNYQSVKTASRYKGT